MTHTPGCMWLDKRFLRYDRDGKYVEAWYTITNAQGDCGREPLFPETWK